MVAYGRSAKQGLRVKNQQNRSNGRPAQLSRTTHARLFLPQSFFASRFLYEKVISIGDDGKSAHNRATQLHLAVPLSQQFRRALHAPCLRGRLLRPTWQVDNMALRQPDASKAGGPAYRIGGDLADFAGFVERGSSPVSLATLRSCYSEENYRRFPRQ